MVFYSGLIITRIIDTFNNNKNYITDLFAGCSTQCVVDTLDKGYSLDFYFQVDVNMAHKIHVCTEWQKMAHVVDLNKPGKSMLDLAHPALVRPLRSPVITNYWLNETF